MSCPPGLRIWCAAASALPGLAAWMQGLTEKRDFYDLESLWRDAPVVPFEDTPAPR
jgi:hypothetical protein